MGRSGHPRAGRRRAATAVVAAVAWTLAGCAGTEPVRPGDGPAETTAGPAVAAPGQDLAVLREQYGIPSCPPSGPGGEVRLGLPSVDLPCLDGAGEVDLATLRGTPTVVNLWATWCGPCREEAPYLAEVAADLDGRVAFLGVDVADPDPVAALTFAGEQGWTYPHLADPERRFIAALGVNGLPQTLFVGPDGLIAHRHVGPVTSSGQLEALVAEHLGVD